MLKARIIFSITLLTAVLGGTMCFSAQTAVVAQRTEDLREVQLENVKIDAQSITSFFADLSFTYDIPVGLEIAKNENESARYYTELEKGTLTDLLTQFVTRHTQYSWKIEDGVVNVFPQDGYRDPLSKDLLAMRIGKFSVKEKTSCWNFVASLLDSPETKSILQANNTTYSRRSPSGFYIPQHGRGFNLNVSDLTSEGYT